jgi:hypothetical protein
MHFEFIFLATFRATPPPRLRKRSFLWRLNPGVDTEEIDQVVLRKVSEAPKICTYHPINFSLSNQATIVP